MSEEVPSPTDEANLFTPDFPYNFPLRLSLKYAIIKPVVYVLYLHGRYIT